MKIKNQIVAMLAAVATLLGLGLVAAAPAQAVGYSSGSVCVDSENIGTCIRVFWRQQADGAGVSGEGFQISTPYGAKELYSDAYKNVQMNWVNPANEDFLRTWNYGVEPASFSKDHNVAGREKGSMDYRFAGTLNQIGERDWRVFIGIRVHANGTYDVQYQFSYEL